MGVLGDGARNVFVLFVEMNVSLTPLTIADAATRTRRVVRFSA